MKLSHAIDQLKRLYREEGEQLIITDWWTFDLFQDKIESLAPQGESENMWNEVVEKYEYSSDEADVQDTQRDTILNIIETIQEKLL
tara:strand:- start:43 stop:300 length:258 start_codon:yes stop_codon:yes gene_type:complete